jgi:hypothetical protein
MKNKFIYLGKIHNCDLLQNMPKKNVQYLNTSTYSNYKKTKLLSNVNTTILEPIFDENDRT